MGAYSRRTETGPPRVSPCPVLPGRALSGQGVPPQRWGHPAPTVRLREGLASCWPVLLTVRRSLYLKIAKAPGGVA